MLNTTLTASQVSKIVASMSNVIELAVMEVIERLPSKIFAHLDDFISEATLAVIESLRTFKVKYASVETITAWVRKRARWTTMNAIKRAHLRMSVPGGDMCRVAVKVDERAEDAARLERALDVLDDEKRTILVALASGEKAINVAKRLKMSNATITRRKQEAMSLVAVALAA